jgi:hypothetical protein
MSESDSAADAAMDQLMRTTPCMDTTVAATLLQETKEIMDGHGVVFFLRQGTCLGAIRDNAFIPWDDDVDIGSIEGLYGFDERVIEPVANTFRARGFHVKRGSFDGETWLGIMKHNVRIDWVCFRVRKQHIVHFPGVLIPVRLFTDLKEIDFIGEKFLVPNPPEEYLGHKYGPNWRTPNRLGYAKDVIDNIPEGPIPGHLGRLSQLLTTRLFPRRAARLRVLDARGTPISGAVVTVVGWGRTKTNLEGYARFYLPATDLYALVIRDDGQEEVLYEEELAPGRTYVYRADPSMPSGRIFVLREE